MKGSWAGGPTSAGPPGVGVGPRPYPGQAAPLAFIYISTPEIFFPSKPHARLSCVLPIYYLPGVRDNAERGRDLRRLR
jgi:hypothetical protein